MMLRGQNRILRMVASNEPLQRVLDELIRFMEAESDEALCSVLVLDEEGTRLHWVSAPSLPVAYNIERDPLLVGPRNGSCGTAIYRRAQVIVTDIASDPLWDTSRGVALSHGLKACTSMPILDSKGDPLGTFAFYYREPREPSAYDLHLIEVSRDLASIAIERSRTFARLEEAVNARNMFLAVASHELKTPLTTLLLQTKALKRALREASGAPGVPLDVQKTAPKIDNLDRQAVRLSRLIDELLDVSKLISGRMDLEHEPVDFVQIVREVTGQIVGAPQHDRAPVELHLEESVICEGDPFRIEQIVTNLLSNALKFSAGKPVEVSVARAGGAARLTVRDHGIGIAQEDQSRIFQQFERAVSVRDYGGFGLGLWLTRQLVERMGGRITVESELGAGSTFTVDLPAPVP